MQDVRLLVLDVTGGITPKSSNIAELISETFPGAHIGFIGTRCPAHWYLSKLLANGDYDTKPDAKTAAPPERELLAPKNKRKKRHQHQQ